ncbi:hypothetical protein [Antribacter gilvus]|uniref:hypothetical protein n=1 Tax=Antribacter gilvus TaxID=2304675 RepID=UPI000F7A2C02|nr:hypothetical protein [Antribacter gilvus]
MRDIRDQGRRARSAVSRLLRGRTEEVLTYSDRTGELCDRRCRGEATRNRALAHAENLLMRPF